MDHHATHVKDTLDIIVTHLALPCQGHKVRQRGIKTQRLVLSLLDSRWTQD